MKKSVGILCGLAIAIAVVTTAGAWYTGKQLPRELDNSIARANQELVKALAGVGGSATIELTSLDRHLFTSTAHYRIKVKDVQAGELPVSFELAAVDKIEHGPFPWSRVKSLKLMPVMAAGNARLERTEATASWFAAANEQSPLRVHSSLGYDGGVTSELELLPLKVDEANGNKVDFTGLRLRVNGDRDGKAVKIEGEAGRLDLTLIDQMQLPVTLQFNGLTIGGDLSRTDHDSLYVGSLDLGLAEARITQGHQQKLLLIKGLEQNNLYGADGDKMHGRLEYKIGDITYDNRPVGSGHMLFTFKDVDMTALQSLNDWYQTRLPEFREAAAAGQVLPNIDMGPEERAKVQADLQKMLAAKPQVALEDLSFKTAKGTSRFNLIVDLGNPASLDLPADQLTRQIIARLQAKLSLSKPMIGDLATLQAFLQGQTDAQAIARQSGQAGEMVGMMAVQSGMARVEGDDVKADLHYADGQVDFNGKKMSVEEFALFLNTQMAGVVPRG
ncbi:YdgA family protein [Pseudomonas capeferrum]|uniref:YdgA family protein n=1 Tax=Pseudomonas capeferrum TaxID=1495066 RepID=UPI0015E3C42D|nr:YdgA family protein [Pseudomonas capeferrum]MBA1201409.1 YdgA family protein [Pseudomonas capeferrum]